MTLEERVAELEAKFEKLEKDHRGTRNWVDQLRTQIDNIKKSLTGMRLAPLPRPRR